MDINVEVEKQKVLAEFHQYWLDNGKPHPSSNAYLKLNRIFFYNLGKKYHDL